MTLTWILVANASSAKLYANAGPKQGLSLVKELDHPESRQKASDLVSDRAGHMQSVGNGHGSRQPQTDPKQNEAQQFAAKLGRELTLGRTTQQCDRIVLVASPAFLGLLNKALDGPTERIVSDRIEKDYTKVTVAELAKHLQSCVYA